MTDESEKPPLFSSWRGWYLLVTGFLLLQILLFTLLTKSCP
jgi:hypothetical protein